MRYKPDGIHLGDAATLGGKMSKDRIKSIIIRPVNNGFRLDEFPVKGYRDPDPNEYVFEDMGKLCDWLKKRFA